MINLYPIRFELILALKKSNVVRDGEKAKALLPTFSGKAEIIVRCKL